MNDELIDLEVRVNTIEADLGAVERKVGHGLVVQTLDTGRLKAKFFFDAALVGLAAGGVALVGLSKPFLQDCSAEVDDAATLACEGFNVYRCCVLGVSVLLLLPAISSTIEFAYITKKGSLTDQNTVVFHVDDRKISRNMFEYMPFAFGYYDAFWIRIPFVLLNWVLLLVSPLVWLSSALNGKKPLCAELRHYCLSLPGLMMPLALLFLAYVLVRDAIDPLECFSNAVSIQVYAYLGSWLIREIFAREIALTDLITPFSKSEDSRSQALDYIGDELGKGLRRASKSATIVLPTLGRRHALTQAEYLQLIAQSLDHFQGLKSLTLADFPIQNRKQVDALTDIVDTIGPEGKVELKPVPFGFNEVMMRRIGLIKDDV